MNNQRILCVIDSLGSGGAQRQIVELAKNFKARGHQVSFLTYHHETFYLEDLKAFNINYTCIAEAGYLHRIIKMRRFIRHGHYDAVLSFLEGANFISEISGLPYRNWKLVVGERSANPRIRKSLKLRLYRWFHLMADHVVANSHENLKIVRKINPLLPASRCKVIYNIVDLNNWTPPSAYIPFENGKLNILVAASHQYLKNAKGLIMAIHQLDDSIKNKIKINWYGDESPDNSFHEAQELVKEYSLQDVFTFYKATRDIFSKIHYADVVGLFSFYEGLPNIVCEAMVLGKMVISSAISDTPQLLGNDLNCTFNPHDIADITKTITHTLSLPADTLIKTGEKNKIAGERLFDKNKIVTEYLNLLNNSHI